MSALIEAILSTSKTVSSGVRVILVTAAVTIILQETLLVIPPTVCSTVTVVSPAATPFTTALTPSPATVAMLVLSDVHCQESDVDTSVATAFRSTEPPTGIVRSLALSAMVSITTTVTTKLLLPLLTVTVPLPVLRAVMTDVELFTFTAPLPSATKVNSFILPIFELLYIS